MRPQVVRATWRAASLATRTSPRTCHTFTAPNQPIVKHSTVASSPPAVYSANDFKASIDSPPKVSHESVLSKTPASEVSSFDGAKLEDSSPIIPDTILTPKKNDHIGEEPLVASASQAVDSIPEKHVANHPQSNQSESLTSEFSDDGLEQSSRVFSHEPPPRQSPSSTDADSEALVSEIRALLKRNSVRSALFHFLAAMKVPGTPAVNESVLKVILPILGRHGWAPAALDAVNLALDREYNFGAGFYNCALHAMSRSGAYDTLHSIIQRMWTLPLDSRPNATSYNYLIGSYMYRGATDKAFDVLHEMKKHMIYPTFATYHALITGCLRSNDPRRAYATLTAVERQRFDVGAMTIAQVLVSCAENDLIDETVHLFPRLEDALPMYSQEVHRIAEKRGAYRMECNSRTTFEERASVRGTTKLEIGALSILLHSAFRNCRADLAVAAWSSLRKNYPDFEIPSPLWYCLIGALAGSGNFEKAFDALGKMRESGLSARLKDLEAALIRPLSLDVNIIDEQYFKLCDKVGKSGSTHALNSGYSNIDNSENVDSEIPSDHGEESSKDTSGTSITNPVREGSLKDVLDAKDVWLGMSADAGSMQPKSVGIEEVNCIIAACSFAGDLHRAFQTYDEVEKTFGLTKNADTFNALLEGCIQVKHARGGERILSEMEKFGFKLTGDTVHLAVRLFTRGGRSAECVDMLKQVRSEGGVVPLQTYLLLIRYYLRGNSVDNAMEVHQMGLDDGYSERLLKGRIDNEGTQKLKEALGGESSSTRQPERDVADEDDDSEELVIDSYEAMDGKPK